MTTSGFNTNKLIENAKSPFDEILSTQRTPIIEINATYAPSDLRDIQRTTGDASISHINSEFKLQHSSAGDKVVMLTGSTGRYTPGVAAEAGVGVRFPDEITGDAVAYYGYFNLDDNDDIYNGAVFGKDSNGNFIAIFRNGTQAVKVYQEDWNISKDINLPQGNVYQIRFTYYGYGLIEFRKLTSETGDKRQEVSTLHTYRPTGEPALANSNLRVGAMIDSTNDSKEYNLYLSGRQFSLIGETNFKERIVSHKVDSVTVGTSDYTPIMSFRQKDSNRATPIKIQEYELLTDNDIFTQWRINSDISYSSGDLTWNTPSDHSADEVSLEVNDNADNIDVSTGVKINESIVEGGSGVDKIKLGKSATITDIPDEYIISLCAKAINSEASVSPAIGKMIEQR